MYVDKIKITDFRNYKSAEADFSRKKNIIIGENAQGKTNFIEAIYLCAFSRSFRTNRMTELIRLGEKKTRIIAEAESEEIEKNIDITLLDNGRKIIKKNGKILRNATELLNNLVVVVFSPEDLGIIKYSPERRRNFIDKELSQLRPKYYESLRNYKEALKQKNALLKDNHGFSGMDLLDVYDNQLVRYGREVINYRSGFIDMLADRSWEIQDKISNGTEKLQIKYIRSSGSDDLDYNIRKSREKDMIRGFSSIGPHRDDIEFYINGRNSHDFASQGQQRTVALSLKLAEVRMTYEIMGEYPILILDDVLSELDLYRQRYLLGAIEDVQLFITSTEVNESVLSGIEGCHLYRVKEGNISREK